MRVYYLEDEYSRISHRTGVTNIKKLPDLLKSFNIGAAQITNIKVDMNSDEFQKGFGKIEFKFVGETHTMNISSLKILK